MYRLSIGISSTVTSARYARAGESETLRLSPFLPDLDSQQFLTGSRVQLDRLAETLRGIVATATDELGEEPGSVEVIYPASWESSQLLLLWEALVLAGIPDAATRKVNDLTPSLPAQASPADNGEALTEVVPVRDAPMPGPAKAVVAARHTSRRKRLWLAVAAIATVVAGVLAGVMATGTPGAARTGGDPASAGSRSAGSRSTAAAPSATTTPATPAAGVALPTSDPLAAQQLIVPRGKDAATQLNLANVAGAVRPHKLSEAAGRNSWPMLSADRRTIIYINYLAGTLRTMAADGSGDRRLIAAQPKGCGRITRASWSPADQSIMLVQCRAAGRPDKLLVIKLDGTVIQELETQQPRIEDPMISPDGRTVAYWAAETNGGPNGGSIYMLALDGSSAPVQLTDRRSGSDADPTWSPDGTMLAFRRRSSGDNFDVYAMRSDGSGVRPIATGPAVEEKPAWSPNGRQIMIISNRDASGEPGNTYDAYVLDLDGGSPRPLGVTANVVLTPVWSYR
jgi:WD40-like Beta Propeller Repeat